MKLKYRPEIDGLRAIAVVPVILFHAGFDTFNGGYTGVDVFFVISGFLITSIIYSELQQGKFSLTNFYERRARRILPLMFCVLLVSLPFAWYSLFTVDMIDFFESLIAIPLFSSNFLFAAESNYFDTSVDLKPLLHTWSLAVEEQYYILFPLTMMALFFLRIQNRLIHLIIALCLLSFSLAVWGAVTYPEYNFYLLPSRAWELALGAIIAVILRDKGKEVLSISKNIWLNELPGLVGLLMIISGVLIIKEDTPFPGFYALLPVVGTALIICFTSKNSKIGAMLSLKPIVIVGLVSYSAYLWHHPLFAFARHFATREFTLMEKSLMCAAIFPISFLSWKYVENPFRNKQRFTRRYIFTFSIIGSVFLLLIGILGKVNDGYPNRDINTQLAVLKYQPDNRLLKATSWNNLDAARTSLDNDSWFAEANEIPNLLLIGNSHSKDIYNIFLHSQTATEYFDIGRVGGQIHRLAEESNGFLSSENYHKADWIVIATYYQPKDLPKLKVFVGSLLADGKKVALVRLIHNFEVFNAKTYADITIQDQIRKGANFESKETLAALIYEIDSFYYKDWKSRTTGLKTSSDVILNEIKNEFPEVALLDRMTYICDTPKQLCYAINTELEKYFYDKEHHTMAGAEFFGKRVDSLNWLEPLIETSRPR